ncbi:MAG: DUF1415 domain-containing protein [Burkholderiales bacterium]
MNPKEPTNPNHPLVRADTTAPAEVAIADTERWLERAVIGLNLCPFAKAVHAKRQIHYAVSRATQPTDLLEDLIFELKELSALTSIDRDTTLLIAPHFLNDFLDFNDFLAQADDALAELRLEGTIQIASFHPDYQFAGTPADDITNATNRSPYPTLHLLREASIERAVESFPNPEAIYGANIETLQRLGADGWAALGVGPSGRKR